MQKMLHFFRENKLAKILLLVLIAFSFLALWGHHHEAGEDAHDCAVCRLAQLIVLAALLGVALLIGRAASAKYFSIREIPFRAPVRISSLRNRAPPFSR